MRLAFWNGEAGMEGWKEYTHAIVHVTTREKKKKNILRSDLDRNGLTDSLTTQVSLEPKKGVISESHWLDLLQGG